MKALIKRLVPAARWLPNYERKNFRGDLSAGLTVAVMLIPQGMAYAMLAGLPPIAGLYASIVPLALYALFGSSRELAVGPVAMVSLLVASGVGALVQPGDERFWMYAVVLAFMVGAIQLLMGVLRLGFIVNFLSHPVISGFTSAAALIIGFSQLKHLLGIDLARTHHIHETVISAALRFGETQWATLGTGLSSVALMVFLKRKYPRFPRALAVVVLGTVGVAIFGLDANGVRTVGAVPAGFPAPSLPMFDLEVMKQLLPMALAISFVGFMESISVAKAFASRQRYEINANQELVGLGLANLAGSFFRAYPVTGGFSRTAVNAQAGSRTPLSSLITAGIIAIALLFLTPLFHDLPKAVLAAIIMTAVFGLIDVAEARKLWRVKRSDFALLALTFVATLTLGIEPGILAGVGASLLWFVVRTTRPHVAVLGRINGTRAYRNLAHYPDAEQFFAMLIVRFDAQMYFGNVSFWKETLKRLEATRFGDDVETLAFVVVDASGVNQLDSSADHALHEITLDYQQRGIRLLLANVKGPVMDVMKRSHLQDSLGADALYLTVDDAVQAALVPDDADSSAAPQVPEPDDAQSVALTDSTAGSRPQSSCRRLRRGHRSHRSSPETALHG